jgi:formylmethanofuran dehydrogenase subunit E
MRPFEELLETSVERHGHLCPGQVVGVRMAMLGCRLIGLDDPRQQPDRSRSFSFMLRWTGARPMPWPT